MYTNIGSGFVYHTKQKRGIRGRAPASAGEPLGDSLEEIPHAHADLVQSFLHAVVVPILFLFFVFFLKLLWERVVPPSGFLVFFFPDVVAVVNVQLVVLCQEKVQIKNDFFHLASTLPGKLLLQL